MYYLIVVILALICLCVIQTRADFELLILHSNDLRGRIEQNEESPDSVYGGFARISALVKEAKAAASAHQNVPSSVLYLNAGDTYTDPVWKSSIGFNLMIEFLNSLSPDVSCLGQHDLNQVTKSLYPFVQKIKYPLIAANLHFQDDYLTQMVKPSVVLERNNKKIGFVGYVSSVMYYPLLPNTSARFEDEIDAIKRESKLLRDQGVDVIVALGYAGFEIDQKIATEVDDVDVVVGGLTNTFLWNGSPPNTENVEGPYPEIVHQRSGKSVPVVQTYGFAKYLGRLHLRFDDKNRLVSYEGRPIFLMPSLSQDHAITSMLNTYGRTLRAISEADIVVGQSVVPLSADNVTNAESNLANFVTDCLIEFATMKMHIRGSVLALMHAGAFKGTVHTSRKAPNITRRMLDEALPTYTTVVMVSIRGKYIVKTLEEAIFNLDDGKLLHIGGGRYIFDPERALYHRITSLRLLNVHYSEPVYQNVQYEEQYLVVTTSSLLADKDYESLMRYGHVRNTGVGLVNAIVQVVRYFQIILPECDDRFAEYGSIMRADSVSYFILKWNTLTYYYCCGLFVLLT